MTRKSEKTPDYLQKLITLLDDSNENIVHGAMRELLKHDSPELDKLLSHEQESSSEALRLRVHQLEAILTVRRRRGNFGSFLAKDDLSVADALIELHLLWFDNDSRPTLEEELDEFLDDAELVAPKTLEELAAFMRRCGFLPVAEQEILNPDHYCIGMVLDSRQGADVIFAILAQMIAIESGLEVMILRLMGDFVLLDRQGTLLHIRKNFLVVEQLGIPPEAELWNDQRQIFHYIARLLFLYSVSSDSFRYVQTIAGAISGEDPDFLVPPYLPDSCN